MTCTEIGKPIQLLQMSRVASAAIASGCSDFISLQHGLRHMLSSATEVFLMQLLQATPSARI